MARTPSMTTAEAESLIGPRGTFVNSDNRALVRKWLCAKGFPSLFVVGLSNTELGLAYKDDEFLPKLRDKLANAGELPSDDGEGDSPKVTLKPMWPRASDGEATAQAAIDALAAVLNTNAKLDEARVIELITQEAPKYIITTRLEVTYNSVKIDLGELPRHHLLETAITVVGQNIPLAMIGPAGSGKTTGAEQIAKALGLPFYMNGAVTGSHEYLGYKDAHGAYHTTPFRAAFEHGGVYLADEIDGGDPAAILVINSALANGHMPFPDQTLPVEKHKDFRMIAAANTYGHGADRIYVGRNQLDGATLDRFTALSWDYDEKLESQLCSNESWLKRVQALRAAAAKEKARVIISPRASIYGAKLLAAGIDRATVENIVVWKGTDGELRRRIEQVAAAAR